MSGKPKTLTPEQEAALIAVVEKELDERKIHGLERGAMGEFLFGFAQRAIEAVGVRVVARDEAAEPKPIGWDDVTDEDVMAALVKAQTEANALRAELQHIADADPSQWDEEVRDSFREWAQSRARAVLRRLAGGEDEK